MIAELVALAQEVTAVGNRGARFSPPITDDELALYDAVAENQAALDVMGEDVLAQIAANWSPSCGGDIRTDWTVRDDVRAELRSSIKRLLPRYGYPRASSRRRSSW